MSSWASIDLGGHTINETQNHFNLWFFRASDRVLGKDPATGLNTYRYEMPGELLRKRLGIQGHDMASLEREFREQKQLMLEDCLDMVKSFPGGSASKLLPAIEETTLADWLVRLRRIHSEKLPREMAGEPLRKYGDLLLEFMLSDDAFYFTYNQGAGTHNFPCTTKEGWAVALLACLPDEVRCTMDITALVKGGWIEAFDDVVEHSAECTVFYSLFRSSLDEVLALTDVRPGTPALPRMLYTHVITAMEAYLSDTVKKQVFKKPAVKRRFVQEHDKFRGKKIDLNSIYFQLEKLDAQIQEVIDTESFHNIATVATIYKQVLHTEIDKVHLGKLAKAVAVRHDLVHRNGKTTKGATQDISMDMVREVVGDVGAAMLHVDELIRAGLFDDVDEQIPVA